MIIKLGLLLNLVTLSLLLYFNYNIKKNVTLAIQENSELINSLMIKNKDFLLQTSFSSVDKSRMEKIYNDDVRIQFYKKNPIILEKIKGDIELNPSGLNKIFTIISKSRFSLKGLETAINLSKDKNNNVIIKYINNNLDPDIEQILRIMNISNDVNILVEYLSSKTFDFKSVDKKFKIKDIEYEKIVQDNIIKNKEMVLKYNLNVFPSTIINGILFEGSYPITFYERIIPKTN